MIRSSRFVAVPAAFVVFCCAALAVAAPTNPLEVEGPVARAYALKAAVPVVAAQPFDREALRADDLDRAEQGLAPRFALPEDVFVTPATDGAWQELDDVFDIWRLRVHAPGSLSLNFGFTAYRLPKGGRLTIHPAQDPQAADERGVFVYTERDNEDHGQLWTPVVLADDVVIELVLPRAARHDYELALTAVNRGYRFFGESPDKSGACNIDVVCPEGDDWRAEINTVAAISTGGSLFCTGFMVNNTAEDETPYFQTAFHCGINSGTAASLVVYWNFQSPTCGQQGGGATLQNQTGSVLRAADSASDFTLVELDDAPDPAWNVSYAGWNNATMDFPMVVGIHHPSGDEKSISFEFDPTTTTSYLGTSPPGDGTEIRVHDWDLGTTEGGSSGSPLFDPYHRVVGQLHGGYAACGNDESDWYGRVSVSWDGTSSATRLRDWLDPGASGTVTLDTHAPWATGLAAVPTLGLDAEGDSGGPFSGGSVVYTLTNRNTAPMDWSMSADVPWVDLSAVSGTLPALGQVDVTVSLNSLAGGLSNGFYTGTLDVVNLTDGEGDTSRPLSVLVGLPKLVHSETLDTDPGWTTEGLWAFGQPTGGGGQYGAPDPTEGFTGPNVYGYNLAGDYENSMPQRHLTSTAFDCTGLTGTEVRFRRWLGVESPSYDHAYLFVSNDNSTWTQVWTNGGQVADNAWNEVEYDISAVADGQATVYLRWTMGITDSSWQFCGWNIDDIEIWGMQNIVSAAGDVPGAGLRLAGHPNPFNPRTTIVFALERPGHAVMEVYDVAGRRVATLLDEERIAGEHRLDWQPRDLSSGVYFVRLRSGSAVEIQRMTLLK